jgi:hypothetical protein
MAGPIPPVGHVATPELRLLTADRRPVRGHESCHYDVLTLPRQGHDEELAPMVVVGRVLLQYFALDDTEDDALSSGVRACAAADDSVPGMGDKGDGS